MQALDCLGGQFLPKAAPRENKTRQEAWPSLVPSAFPILSYFLLNPGIFLVLQVCELALPKNVNGFLPF